MPSGFPTPAFLLALAVPALAGASESFEKARLILETKCVSCHYPEKTKGDLLLTTREHFLKGGESGPAMVLEHLEMSEILVRVKLEEDDDEIMPPKGKPLTAEEIGVLEAWMKEG